MENLNVDKRIKRREERRDEKKEISISSSHNSVCISGYVKFHMNNKLHRSNADNVCSLCGIIVIIPKKKFSSKTNEFNREREKRTADINQITNPNFPYSQSERSTWQQNARSNVRITMCFSCFCCCNSVVSSHFIFVDAQRFFCWVCEMKNRRCVIYLFELCTLA